MTLNLPNELVDKLNQIKTLLSHKDPNMRQADLISEMAEIVLNKLDPQRRKTKERKQRTSLAAPTGKLHQNLLQGSTRCQSIKLLIS